MKAKDRIFLSLFIFFSLVIIIEACIPSSGSSSQSKVLAWLFDRGPATADVVSPTSFNLEGETTLYIGETNTYQSLFSPENTTDKRVTYVVSGDKEAVSLSSDGKLTGLKAGEVTLIATSLSDGSLSSSLIVSVSNEPITSLSLGLSQFKGVIKGMSVKSTVTSNLNETPYNLLSFSSSDTNVATIDEDGFIYTKNTGTTIIQAASKENNSVVSNQVPLSVVDGTLIATTSLNYSGSTDLYIGENRPLGMTFNHNASDRNVKVVTDDTTLTYQGESLIGLKAGSSTVVVSSLANPELNKSITFNVLEVKATKIILSEASLQYGKTLNVKYTLSSDSSLPVTNKEVLFSSSDTSIASIDDNGLLVGYKKGNVKITASWKEDPTIADTAAVSITSVDGETFDNINYWTRKIIGHFSLFMVTGVFGMLFSYDVFFKKKKLQLLYVSLVNLVYGFSLAGISELCQMTAKGRGPSMKDVGIDTAGYALAIVVLVIIILIIKYKQSKKKKLLTVETK